MIRFLILSLTVILFASCEVKPVHIEYGVDACHFCDMNIVDQQHASQMVSKKGKGYKFDAVECMIHAYQDELKDTEMALILSVDFNNPGEFIDAKTAGFLVSEKIQSPMGENLSAFKNIEEARKAQEEYTGTIYNWEEIQKHLNR